MASISVRYHAHHLELSGYGRAAAGYIEALNRTGEIDLDVVPVDAIPTAAPVDVAIYHTKPDRLETVQKSPARRHVALTTWETEPMPEAYAEALWGFDAVIVPSNFCKDLARLPSARDEHSLKARTHVIPHGFDPTIWSPQVPTLKDPNGVVTFYSIGAWGERKNTLGLLKAYLHAFRRKDKTRLVLIIDKVNLPAIHSLLARSLIPRDELPGIVIPDHRLSDEEILKLHQDGDCFVTATRSEGFGLPIFEAAIMGKPIVSPKWGGQIEFLDEYPNARIVWHAMTPVFPGEDEASFEPAAGGPGGGGGAMRVAITLSKGANCSQIWAEPSLDRLATEMKMIRADFRESRLHDNHSRRAWFEKHYGFDAIGAQFVNTLKEILR